MVGGGRRIECRVHGMAPYSAHDTTSLKGCNGTAHGKCKAIITRFRARSIGLADIYTPYPAIITALVPRNAVTLRFIERYFAWRWMCTRATQATRVYIYTYIYRLSPLYDYFDSVDFIVRPWKSATWPITSI